MSLQEMNALENEAYKADREYSSNLVLQDQIKQARANGVPVAEFLTKSNYVYADAKSAVAEVLSELAYDIYRLTEMRLQVKARELKMKAAQKRAIITAGILPLPKDALK